MSHRVSKAHKIYFFKKMVQMKRVAFSKAHEVRTYVPDVWVNGPQSAKTRGEQKKIDAILRGACSICDPSSKLPIRKSNVCDACLDEQKVCNEKLHTSGYVVFRNACIIGDDSIAEIDDTRFKPIFNGVTADGALTYDGFRLQGNGEWGQKVKRILNKFLFSKAILTEDRRIAEMYALRSLPSCVRQPRHTDSAPEKSLLDQPHEDVPLAMLYAIEDNTWLKIWPFDTPYCVLRLSKGDMVVFRGDMAHCGAEYKEINTRIHAYIDSNKQGSHKRRKGSTWIDDKML
jgi:hypothetical protein